MAPSLFAPAQYPFTPKTFRLTSGHRLSYLDEGDGAPLVMAHGNPSWSYLYRNVVAQFKSNYRCVVPDHLGCGFSDKPQDYPYRLQNHIDNF
ncbi:MAG: alpha/beta fold hydrolase, partial [Candidatus Electrothrix sp. MAN1_4]|nr:alpha/beta fold hydrolase [Candidatus Electrothrix sp. MAN1_4]